MYILGYVVVEWVGVDVEVFVVEVKVKDMYCL